MPYNPNSVWDSKGKKYVFAPTEEQKKEAERAQKEARTSRPVESATQAAQPSRSMEDNLNGPSGPSFLARHGLWLFGGGIALLIVFALVVFYLLLPPATPNITMTFSDVGTVTMGEPFPLTITVANDSKSAIQGAELTVTLPQGLSFVGSGTTPDQRALMESIGTLSSNTVNPPITIEVIATADGGSSQTITGALTYGTSNTATTQFQSNGQTAVSVGTQSAITLNYSAPSSIFSGSNFNIDVNYANVTGETLSAVQLKMSYPPAYHFISSGNTVPVDAGDTTWDIGDLAPSATGTLVLTGNLVGPTNAQYQLNGSIGATFNGQNYPAISAPANFVVAPSPLSFTLTLNNTSTYISKAGENLNYTLSYTNNSTVAFQTVNIQAVLSGAMFDPASLKTTGAFNSQNGTITWYTANTPSLASLAPGQTGSVTFSIYTKAAFPIKQVSNKNYTLGVNAQIQSPTVPPNTAGSSTVSVASLTTKVGGQLALTSLGFVKETAVPSIVNSGPFPPKVDQPTTYTIHWTLTNYATDMQNVTVSAYLQSGTTFTGAVTSTVPSSTPTYNAATGLVTWTIPYIPATAGVISPPAEAIFQVSNTPAVNQVNQDVTLVGQTTLTGTDVFTGLHFSETAAPITTQFNNDPSVANVQGAVTQ